MLVLTRQIDQSIIIDGNIEVTIVDVRGDKVRVGVTAPSRIAVHRKEIHEAIKRNQESQKSKVKSNNAEVSD